MQSQRLRDNQQRVNLISGANINGRSLLTHRPTNPGQFMNQSFIVQNGEYNQKTLYNNNRAGRYSSVDNKSIDANERYKRECLERIHREELEGNQAQQDPNSSEGSKTVVDGHMPCFDTAPDVFTNNR